MRKLGDRSDSTCVLIVFYEPACMDIKIAFGMISTNKHNRRVIFTKPVKQNSNAGRIVGSNNMSSAFEQRFQWKRENLYLIFRLCNMSTRPNN